MAGCSLSYAVDAVSSDTFALNPSLSLSEEYTDNVFETETAKRTDFITRIMPGLAFATRAPFWDWDVAYNFDYRYYAKNSRTDDTTHNLLGSGQIRLIENFFLIDLNDTYSRVSLNIGRDKTQESLFLNQSDSNNFSVSPFILLHPGSKITTKTGYRYINVWFKDPTGIDRRDHVGFMDATYALTPQLGLTANYVYTHENSVNSYDRHEPSAGFKYEYRDKSFFSGQGGYTWFRSLNGVATNNPFWNVELTHGFSLFSVTLATGIHYPVDPQSGVTRETDYSFALNKALQRGNVGINAAYAHFSGETVDIKNRLSGGFSAQYNLTTNLHGSLAFSVERYDHAASQSTTTRYYVNPNLTYLLPKDISLALNYTFVDSSSPSLQLDNFRVNRVMLEVKKSFGRVLESTQTTDKGPL